MARDGDWDPENPFEDERPVTVATDTVWGFTGFKYKGLKIKPSQHGPGTFDTLSLAVKQILPHLLKGKDVQFQDFVPDVYSTNIVAQFYTWVWTLASVEEDSSSPYYATAIYKPFVCYATVKLDPHEIAALPDLTMLYDILKVRLLNGLYTLENEVLKLKASLKPITGYEYIPSTCDAPYSGAHTLYKLYSVKTPKYGLPNL